ncbi:MAG: hypothetical protein U0271_34650 [Polyangiaceae bacterium]
MPGDDAGDGSSGRTAGDPVRPETRLAQRWLRAIPSIGEVDLRIGLFTLDFEQWPADALAEALEEVSLLGEQTDARARAVLAAAVPCLTDPQRVGTIARLRELAHERGHFALARLLRHRDGLRDGHHEIPEPHERHPGDARVGRAVTLGERKALARGHDRFALDRLLRDPHPAVIRNVLSNPRITEDDVVRLAARRPTFPDIQLEIARSPKWSVRSRVRVALAQNPYTPPTVAVPLLSLLIRHELEEVRAATDLPPIVRSAAIDLLERRPPIPEPQDTPIKQ